MRSELTHAQIEQLITEIEALTEARDKLVGQIAVSLKADRRQPIDVETSLREKEKLLAQAEQDLATLHRTLAEKRSRLDVLRQLNEEGEGLAEGSQALLEGSTVLKNSGTRLPVRSLHNSMLIQNSFRRSKPRWAVICTPSS